MIASKREGNSEEVKTAFFKRRMPFFGWGRRIRTFGMTESESVALPLGDTPKYYIAEN